MRTIRTKVYKFNELTQEAKEAAINNLYDISVSYDWWEYLYEDAKEIGLKITGFDSAYYCSGEFLLAANEVAQNIFNEHGKDCESYKTAEAFMNEWQPIFNNYMETEENEDKLIEIETDFLNNLLQDYRILLRNEYEYQTSKEALIETIEANDYEFYSNGKLI